MISLVTMQTAAGIWRCECVVALLRAKVHLPHLAQGDEPSVRILHREEGRYAVARVRAAVLEGEADAAVHSAEDLPGPDHEKLEVIAILPRCDPRDALYSSNGAAFARLGRGARVGAAGTVRAAQLAELRPDLCIVELVDGDAAGVERVGHDLDAVVVPAIALELLGLPACERFPLGKLVPGVGRGAIALEVRAGQRRALELLAELDDPRSRLQVMAERAVFRRLQAWPAQNLGVAAEVQYGSVTLYGALAAGARSPVLRAQRSGPAAMASQVAASVASALLLQEGSASAWR